MSTEPAEQAQAPVATGPSPCVDLSIIVLTYNRVQLLRDCIASLVAQSYPAERLEILIADDGSSDGTADLVRTFTDAHPHIRHLRHEHRGIPATRNLGIRHAHGALIAIVADDYVLDREYAGTIVHFFRQHPDASVVRFAVIPSRRDFGSRVSHVYYQTSILRRLASDPGESSEGFGSSRPVSVPPGGITTRHGLDASGGAAFRREVFDRVGLFDETLERGEDSDLTVRLRRNGLAVHYNPHHSIRHQYDPYLRDTLVKCWLSGWYGYHYYRKNGSGDVPQGIALRLLRGKAAALVALFRQARLEKSTAWFLLAVPFALTFEAANKAGFVCSWMWDRVRQRRRRAPMSGAPSDH